MINSIIETIKVPSEMLNNNIKINIEQLLIKKIGTVTKQYGCIKSIILNSIAIKSAEINTADSSNEFTIEYSFESFKPIIGLKYLSTIVEIYPEGIIVNIDANIDALIIGTRQNDKTTMFENCNCIAEKTANLLVTFDQIAFKAHQFQCVGRHVH